MAKHQLTVFAGALLLAGGCSSARAGTFQVQPVRIELSSSRLSTTVQVRNLSPEGTTIQAQVVAWTADGVEEILKESNDVLLNPPIFTVAPGQAQFMRVGLRRAKPAESEVTYRLILEEVPPPVRKNFAGVNTLLKISVPIFVLPAVSEPDLVWGVRRVSSGQTQLWVENRGNAHVQIRRLEIHRNGRAEPEFRHENMSYVLPAGRKEWLIPGAVLPASGLSVRAQTDIGDLSATLGADSP
jgi:fimbrial chaperone protein